MALPPLRSMNGNLAEGMVEGGHKRKSRDRGGFVEETTNIARENLDHHNFTVTEDFSPRRPDETQNPWSERRRSSGTTTYESQLRHQ